MSIKERFQSQYVHTHTHTHTILNTHIQLQGFSTIMLPGDPPRWADETGRKINSNALNKIAAGEGWQWTTNWTSSNQTTSPVDSEGWSYSQSFSTPSDRWHGSSTNARVRRRCWIRKRRRTDSAAEANRLLRAGRDEADRQREELHRRHSTQQYVESKKIDSSSSGSSSSSNVSHVSEMRRSRGALETSMLGRSVVLPDRVVDDIVDAVKQLQRDAADRAAEGKWDEAIDCLTQAIDADCTKSDLYASRSRALCVKGEYARALTDANVCIATSTTKKNSCIGYCCKGQALCFMRQFESAERAFKRALECDVDSAEAQKGLSNAHKKLCDNGKC